MAAHGRDEVAAFLAELQHGIDAGTTFQSLIERLACRPLAGGGVCAIEITQTVHHGDETRGPFRERISIALEKLQARLVWVHWHASTAAAPR